MVSEVLTDQNSLQREQGKNIVGPFCNSPSSNSHQAHIIVLTCQKLPREVGEKECVEKGILRVIEGELGCFAGQGRDGEGGCSAEKQQAEGSTVPRSGWEDRREGGEENLLWAQIVPQGS